MTTMGDKKHDDCTRRQRRGSLLLLVLVLLLPARAFLSNGATRTHLGSGHIAAALFRPSVTSSAALLFAATKDASATADGSPTASSTVDKSSTLSEVEEDERWDSAVRDARLSLLNDALRNFNSSAAKELVSELSRMRNDTSGNMEEAIETFLNDLLSRGPDRELPFWSRFFRPLARCSRRARLASLRRTLDMATPPANAAEDMEEEDDDVDDDSTADSAVERSRRRRRALVSLLRTLSNPLEGEEDEVVRGPAIRWLEKKARREAAAAAADKNEDLISRRPVELETPEYTVLTKRSKNGMEIRRYEAFSVCSVSMTKPRPADAYKTDATISDSKTGSARAFGALAGYLFGKNQQKTAMKMTAPVFNQKDQESGDRQMSFVLPSDYWGKDGFSKAPKPLKASGVTLQVQEAADRAVIMFGGYASKQNVRKRTEQLLEAIDKDPEWEPANSASKDIVSIAQYNDPFTPPWKRLNEVSIPVVQRREKQ